MDWLEEIVSSHSELESPKSFWRWSALCAISAIVKDNVWFDKQIYNLYPNIYVMLHADSGLKKGPPINFANRLVSTVNNTNIITGRSSIQAILKDMATAKTQPGGKIVPANNAFLCFSELSASIVSDPVAMDVLTDMYDRHYRVDVFRSLLKSEEFTIKNPTITMLSGSNEAHTNELFGQKDVQGGYFARTFIIYENKRQTINSLMYPLNNPPNDKLAAEYLKEIAGLRGQFTMDNECRKFFHDWYVKFTTDREEQQVKDSTGTLNRFDDSVLKVAMLTSLARKPELVITLDSIIEATADCEKLVGNVRRATAGSGKHAWATQKGVIIQELLNRTNHTMTRTQLNRKYYLQANSDEWDQIMVSLEAAGFLKIEMHGNNVMYVMSNESVDNLAKHYGGK